jgi:hypothetical protein
MVGDELLVQEGKEQEREADEEGEGGEHREPSDNRHERPTRGS